MFHFLYAKYVFLFFSFDFALKCVFMSFMLLSLEYESDVATLAHMERMMKEKRNATKQHFPNHREKCCDQMR